MEVGRRDCGPGRTLALAAFVAAASTQAVPGAPAEGITPRVVASRLSGTPRIEDFATMEPEGVGREMSRLEGFVTRAPRDGEPLSERTVVYLGFDDEHLYAAFVCFDSDPSGIRAQLRGRDRIPDAEDSVALQLDTFRDLEHAYGFQVNASGVQQDGLWTEGQGWDLSFDAQWESEALRTDTGYVVLLRVPFRSLRFSGDEAQSWGLLCFRSLPRRSEAGFWPAYSTRIAGRMNQAGVLEGLGGIRRGRNAQVIPYASARATRDLRRAPASGPAADQDASAEIGGDAKLVVRDSLALDLTANPDFSQIESDEPQVTVNQRFEVFFPEKRPFFVENASFFSTPIPLLFTRRIVDPRLGARVSGRVGRYAIGALLAEDRMAEGTSAGVGVVRVNRDLGSESTLGVFLGDRERDGGWNRVGALDARIKLSQHWVATAQLAASRSRESGGGTLSGVAYRATLQRSGQSLNYRADLNGRSDAFRSELGFIERAGIRSLDQAVSCRFRPENGWLLSWGPDLVTSHVWEFGGGSLDASWLPSLNLEWPRLTTLTLFYRDARVSLAGQAPGGPAEAFSQDRWGLAFGSSFAKALTLRVEASEGRDVNLAPVRAVAASAADSTAFAVTAEFRPSGRLTLATSYLLTRLVADAAPAPIFSSAILRGRLGYQFTRAISARAIVETDSLTTDPRATSLRADRRLNLDFLVTWLRTPGTAVYIGFNDNLRDVDGAPGAWPTDAPSRRTLRSEAWQFFLKASWLFRL